MGLWDDYVATPVWASNRPVASDGAPPTGEQWRVTQEDLYDRAEYLHEGGMASKTVTRHYGPEAMTYLATEWAPQSSDECVRQTTAGAAQYVRVRIEVPHGATITNISARVQPVFHGTLPAVMPRIYLMRKPLEAGTFGTVSSVQSAVDSSANTTAYNAAHSISMTLSGGGHVVDRAAYAYFVRFEGESGTGDEDQLEFHGVSVTYSTGVARDPGAA